MSTARVLYRVYRRRGPMVPALLLGLAQILAGVDTLFTHVVLPAGRSPVTSVAAALFILLGLVLIVVVSVNMFGAPPLIQATDDGLLLSIAAPGEPAVRIPWDALKAVELGRAGPSKERRDDPLCLILRFAGARVRRPAKLHGVLHSTKGSFYIRGSHLPNAVAVSERLNALLRERRGSPAPAGEADED